MNPYSILYSVGSAVSALLSGFVVLTGILFPQMMLSTSRPFSHILFFISLCDMIGGAFTSLGFPSSDTLACQFQGFFMLEFVPASWLFTVAMIYQLRCFILNKPLMSLLKLHIIVWSIATLLTLLPLTTNNYYGMDDVHSGVEPCQLGGDDNASYIWNYVSFNGTFIVCTGIMSYYTWEIRKELLLKKQESSQRLLNILNASKHYVFAMLISWLPIILISIILKENIYYHEYLPHSCQIFIILSTQYGTFLTIVFFHHSPQARGRWYDLLYKKDKIEDIIIFYDNEDADDDLDNDSNISCSDIENINIGLEMENSAVKNVLYENNICNNDSSFNNDSSLSVT
jgi:hypothetical protein